MCDFNVIPESFYIRCYDYLSGTTFLSKQSYETYEDAKKALSSLVPPSVCCGFEIITMPKLESEQLEFVNGNFKK